MLKVSYMAIPGIAQLRSREILNTVAEYYGIRDASEIIGRNRRQSIKFARQLCMTLYRLANPKTSFEDIGKLFSDGKPYDHTTVMWAMKNSVKHLCQTEGKTRTDCIEIARRLGIENEFINYLHN
jgi:chromosomal replication initiation ATPase DnaA